jgi:type II secretory pathway component PulJ
VRLQHPARIRVRLTLHAMLARVYQIIERTDTRAGGLFAKARDQRVDDGSNCGEQQLARNPERKSHMLKVGFANPSWMGKEQGIDRVFHWMGPVFPKWDNLGSLVVQLSNELEKKSNNLVPACLPNTG